MNDQRLIQDYSIEMCSPACVPGASFWSARATLQADISEALPLLNARLPGADYDHSTGFLLWKNEGHKYAFRPDEIDAAPASDREEGEHLLERAVAMVNEVWSERDTITPNYEKKTVPDMMAIYKLLPRATGCRACGYATCLAFAGALRNGTADLARCTVLEDDAHAHERGQLREMLGLPV